MESLESWLQIAGLGALVPPEQAGITILLTISLPNNNDGQVVSVNSEETTYTSSKANADVMKPDKRTAATRMTSDLTNIVNKGRSERKKKMVMKLKWKEKGCEGYQYYSFRPEKQIIC